MRSRSARKDLLRTGSHLYNIISTQRFATATWQGDIEAEKIDVPTQSQPDVVRELVMPQFEHNSRRPARGAVTRSESRRIRR